MKALFLAVLIAVSAPAVPAAAPPQAFTLATGLDCVLLESHERPLVRLELVTRWDPRAPAAATGQVGFLVDLLEQGGAGSYSRAGFNRATDDLGIEYRFQGRLEGLRWTLLADSRAQEAAFELLADAAFRPAFDGPQVEGRRQVLLRRAGAQPPRERSVATFLAGLGQGDCTLPPGTDLAAIGYPELLALQRTLVRPQRSTLAILGDLSLAQAKELAMLHFGVWGGTGPAALPMEASKPASGRSLMTVLEGGARAELWVGARRPEENAPNALNARALDELLALLLEGWPGNAGPGLSLAVTLAPGGSDPLLFKASAGDEARATLVPGLLAVLARLRESGFTQAELDRARLRWRTGREALALHPADLLRRSLDGALEPALAAAVEASSLAEVNRRLGLWLKPAGLRHLLLGADAELVQAARKAGLGDESGQPGA